jgi:hypothetical protein
MRRLDLASSFPFTIRYVELRSPRKSDNRTAATVKSRCASSITHPRD